jgi:hypothetical protein
MAEIKRKWFQKKQIFIFLAIFLIMTSSLVIIAEAKKKCQPIVNCKDVYYTMNMTDGKTAIGHQTFCITLSKCGNNYYIDAGVISGDKKVWSSLYNNTEIKELFKR